MSINTGSVDRETLRRTIHAALSDTLLDVATDARGMNVLPLNLPASHQPRSYLFGSNVFDAPMIPSLQQVILAQSLFPSRSNAASMDFGSSLPVLGGLSPSELLLSAVAAEKRSLYDQARISLLSKQIGQERERMLLRDSYEALLREKSGTSLGAMANQSLLLQLISPQVHSQPDSLVTQGNPNPPSVGNSLPETENQLPEKKSAKALEALGSSLRQSTDPYIDVSFMEDPDPEDSQIRRTRGGVTEPFPEKLHRMLEETQKEGLTDVVSFFSHGRAFSVHDIDKFVVDIMPRFFKQSKWNSFARQLNLYGFIRITSGPDAGGYYHELFLKGRPNLSFHMRRVGVPQGKDRRKCKSQLKTVEPDFYSMTKVTTSSTNPN